MMRNTVMKPMSSEFCLQTKNGNMKWKIINNFHLNCRFYDVMKIFI